jgi:hypothetical protein
LAYLSLESFFPVGEEKKAGQPCVVSPFYFSLLKQFSKSFEYYYGDDDDRLCMNTNKKTQTKELSTQFSFLFFSLFSLL